LTLSQWEIFVRSCSTAMNHSHEPPLNPMHVKATE